MTDRLEKVIRELSETDVEQLTRYAECLARAGAQHHTGPGEPMKLDWAGCLKNGPYRSGLEAQEAAKHYRIFLLEKGMPR
jgi:hypothetical protein